MILGLNWNFYTDSLIVCRRTEQEVPEKKQRIVLSVVLAVFGPLEMLTRCYCSEAWDVVTAQKRWSSHGLSLREKILNQSFSVIGAVSCKK